MHKLLPRHDCQACVAVCPVQAITATDTAPTLNAAECLHCGRCLFVCPTDALDHLQPETRRFRASTLVAPFSTLEPFVDELLMWHQQVGIRAVEMDIETFPGWVRAVAALNIRLRELNIPVWQILPPPKKTINTARRHFIKASEVGVQSATVPTGRRARRQAFFVVSEYQLSLDHAQCTVCGACSRVCGEKALRLSDGALTFWSSSCTGCNSCAVVCPVNALRIDEQVSENRELRFSSIQKSCRCCQREFYTFDPETERCAVCQRHIYGMREA
ncbi:4Fe-4S binding protein [Enterobacteriaceae bacterium H4N4]|uniref:4Fe-4S binding protein n=1 Tax=Silvania confinis TaxID=2926470 RepID=A0A9J6QKF2_9ENTR|nr:4Fe-4S binding protein [Silvania confinis]MCU6671324.1 4Fe-4S binding protein [Silvania confinis]